MSRLTALLALGGLVLAACGTNVSREEIRTAAGVLPSEAGPHVEASGDTTESPHDPATGGAAPSSGDDGSTGDPAPDRGPGSTTDSATTGPDRRSEPAASACPDPCDPLVIGAVGTWSGLVGQNVVGGLDALRAWVAMVNETGALGGRQVRLEVADDGADPARHRALVQEMVEQRGVVAFVYNAAVFSGQASVGYLEARRVPVVGGAGTDPWYATSPMFFSQVIAGDVAIEATVASYARSAKQQGISKLGLITCSDGVQVCQDTQRLVPRFAEEYGLDLVYQGQASLASPDFTSNCIAARNAGAQLLYLALDANSYSRIGRSCSSVGYRPTYGIPQPVMLESLAKDPNLQGSPGVSYTAPFFYDANPAVADFRRVMGQYSPSTALTGSTTLGWTAAKLLEAAAGDLPGTPSSSDLLDALWSLDGTDLGGFTPPLRFNRDAPTVPPVCYWQVVVADQRYASPDNGTRHCEAD